MSVQAKKLIARGARISAESFEEDFLANGEARRARFSGIGESFDIQEAGFNIGGTASMRVMRDCGYTPKLRDAIEVRGLKFYVSDIFPLPLEGWKCSLEARR